MGKWSCLTWAREAKLHDGQKRRREGTGAARSSREGTWLARGAGKIIARSGFYCRKDFGGLFGVCKPRRERPLAGVERSWGLSFALTLKRRYPTVKPPAFLIAPSSVPLPTSSQQTAAPELTLDRASPE